MDKKLKLSKGQIRDLATGHGACIATDMIVVEGRPVRFMYRQEPDNDIDSGWRFMSGFESDDYMNDPVNHAIYDVNTIANYDPRIIRHLHAPIGSAFEQADEGGDLEEVFDFEPPED